MVALTKALTTALALGIVLMGSANAQKAPEHTPEEMARVVDCQAQCISTYPPFHHKPDHRVKNFMRVDDKGRMDYLIQNIKPIVRPCLRELKKLNGDASKVTEKSFQDYVWCNSKTLTKNEEQYFSKSFNPKKHGFSDKEWAEFRNRTLPAFRSALHRCRGGCRRIHF